MVILVLKFFANIFYSNVLDDNILKNVLPADDRIIAIAKREDIYTAKRSSLTPAMCKLIETFVKNLSVGQPLEHEYFTTDDLETLPSVDGDFGFKRSLISVLPGTGIKPVIKSIKIGGKEIEKIDILEQLFIRNSRSWSYG